MTRKQDSLTLRQIAKLAGTSKSTVSRVLTRHPSVSGKTRERVEEVIKEHGFEPNLFARGLAGGRTGLIAVICSEITSGFFAEVIHGIDEITQEHDGHLLSCVAHGTDDYIELWRNFSKRGRVDGIILIAPPVQIFERAILENDIPVTLCAARPEDNTLGWSEVDTVTVNNEKGMTDVLEHLYAHGARRLLHLSGPRDVHDARARKRSFQKFVRRQKDVTAEIEPSGLSVEDGFDTMSRYLESHETRPDAIVCFNDSTAYGALQALKTHAISVPEQVRLTGFDDDTASAILNLTTLHMPMREVGRESARLLFDRLTRGSAAQKARHSLLELALEVRSSSRGA